MVFATIYGVIAMIETLNSVLNDSDIFKIEEKIRLIRQKNRIWNRVIMKSKMMQIINRIVKVSSLLELSK